MTARNVRLAHGRKLGTLAVSTSDKAKQNSIQEVSIWNEDKANIGIRTEHEGKVCVLRLTYTSAIEIAKGVLQNLHYIHTTMDEELVQILRNAQAEADKDVSAVQECLKRPYSPTTDGMVQ